MTSIIFSLETLFEKNKNYEIALGQKKYLRDQFSFLGLKTPVRRQLQKEAFNQHKIESEKKLLETLQALWEKEEREYQHAAVDLALKYKKRASKEALPIYEKMIRTKSWWDTVDIIASNLIGALVLKYPLLKKEVSTWINDSDLWIRRSALLFQLKYKEKADKKLLFSLIEKTIEEEDFFIRKAIGWVLREHSKIDPLSIQKFIEKNEKKLSNLSIKEGSKYL